MDWIRVAVILMNGVLFASLGIYVVRRALRDPSPRLRALSWVVAATSGAFFVSALHRLALQALWLEWLTAWEMDFLLTEWQLAQSLASLALGVIAWVVIRRSEPGLRSAERMVMVLTERVPVDVSVSELGLTVRELQVLELIGQGILSDREIAEALYISSGTVRSHVKNILRKAGAGNRRDLMLLASSSQRPSS
jgi:DNA-binding CsgD family transcriptional regulator